MGLRRPSISSLPWLPQAVKRRITFNGLFIVLWVPIVNMLRKIIFVGLISNKLGCMNASAPTLKMLTCLDERKSR